MSESAPAVAPCSPSSGAGPAEPAAAVEQLGAALAALSAPVDWAAQAGLLEREALRAGPGRTAASLFFEAGRLRAEHLSDAAGAEALWRAAAQADPTFGPAARAEAQAEEERARAEGRHDDRLRALERRAALSAPSGAAALLAAAAAVAEERLERPALAADLALRAFDLAPGDAALRREARRHAEREGRDASLARVLEAEASDEATSAREAGLALCALSRLLSGPLDDPDEARARLLAARRRGGEDPIVLDTLAALHEERGEWELAAEALRARAAAQAGGTSGEVVELVAGHLRLAEICEERLARAEEAVAGYQAVLAIAPGHRTALAALGRLFAHAGDWEQLLATFLAERDAAADPREKAHRAFKAGEVLEERLARPAEAVERYREALALDPALCAARQGLERLYATLGRHAELAALLEEGLAGTAAEERIAALMQLARLHEDRLGDAAAASRAWERVLELAPEHVVALRALSGLHDRTGRFAELVAVHERLLAVTQDRGATLAVLQRTAEVQEDELGDADAARFTLERILKLDPTHRPALRALGRLCARSGRWAELVRMCRAEAEVAPSPAAAADLQFRAAEILERRLGDEAEALAGYREVLTLAPEHLGALAALARLHRTRGAWESLVEVLRAQAAVRGAPERRAALLCEVAELWETRLGDPAHAVEVHLEALAEVPAFARSLRALDRLLAAAGRHAELAALLRDQAEVAQGPSRTAALLRAARLYAERLGDRAAALQACRAALSSAPGDPGASLLAAELEGGSRGAALDPSDDPGAGLRAAEEHEAAGRLEEAADALRRALVAAPGALPAVCALARVAARRGDLAEARNALRSQAALLADGAAAAAALGEAGELSRRLGDAAGAAADWTAALARAPRQGGVAAQLLALLRDAPDPAALLEGPERALEAVDAAIAAAPARGDGLALRARLLARAGRHAEAARDLTSSLGLGVAAAEATTAHLELAALYGGPLADPARAVSHLQAVLATSPAEVPALERLAALHRRAENWPGAADALRRLLALPELPAAARCAHLVALAELRAGAFGDGAAALALYEEARRLAPEDGSIAAAIARHAAPAEAPAPAIVMAEPEPVAGALLDEQRRLLAQDPGRVESWRALFRVFHATQALDRAFVVAGVLRFLQPAEPDPAGARPAERPPAAAAAGTRGGVLAEAEWQLLRHPGDRGPLSEILALASDALCEVAQLPAPPRSRERPDPALERLVEEAWRAFDLRPIPLRAGGEGAALTLVPGDPVVAYAGPELSARWGPAEQRFLAARAAARVRARSALATRLAAPALRDLLAATLLQIAPDDASLGVPPDALVRAVGRAIPRKIRKALEEPVHALQISGAPDVAEWQAALAASAARGGLLVAGDVPAALGVALAEGGLPAGTPAERAAAARDLAPLRDLLLFAASDAHFQLRRRLGRAVA